MKDILVMVGAYCICTILSIGIMEISNFIGRRVKCVEESKIRYIGEISLILFMLYLAYYV